MTNAPIVTTLGEVEIGDKVLHPSGEFVEVTDIHEQGEGALYRVWTDDGTYLDTSGDHRWRVEVPDLFEDYHGFTEEELAEIKWSPEELREKARQWRMKNLGLLGKAPSIFAVGNDNKIYDANSWFPHNDPSNDGEQVNESSRSVSALEGIPTMLLAAILLYGKPKSVEKNIPTSTIELPEPEHENVLEVLDRIGVGYEVSSGHGTPGTVCVTVTGSMANNITLAYQLNDEWGGLLIETHKLNEDKAKELVREMSNLLSLTGAVSRRRAIELSIDVDGKEWVVNGGWAKRTPTLTLSDLDVPESDLGQDYIWGFMNTGGQELENAEATWRAQTMSRQLEDSFLRRGLKVTLIRAVKGNGYTALVKLPVSGYDSCSNFLANYTPKNKDEVIRGMLAASTVVSKNGQTSAYVKRNDKTEEYLEPLGYDICGRNSDLLHVARVPEHLSEFAANLNPSTPSSKMYDANGYRVGTLPWIFDNCDVGDFRGDLMQKLDIAPTAVAVTPLISEHGGKTFVRASMPFDMYRVDQVLDALADACASTNEEPTGNTARGSGIRWSNVTTLELQEQVERIARNEQEPAWPVLPEQHAMDIPGAPGIDDLPIHPYVLGCWLGDGAARSGEIAGTDTEMLDIWEKYGYKVIGKKHLREEDGLDFWTCEPAKGDKTLGQMLAELGFAPRKHDHEPKHIPDLYKFADTEARLELLRGLMDMSGTHSGAIWSLHDKLVGDIAFLARGLGMRCLTRESDEPGSVVRIKTDKYRIFNLVRKAKKWDESPTTVRPKRVVKIEKLKESGRLRCITVNSSDHLFVAGNGFITSQQSVVIHNQLLQLFSNNSPSDLQVKMVEPKVGMQIFENADSVTGFVDSWFPRDGEFFEATLDLVRGETEEMIRRNKLMRLHPERPEKLSEAREIALREGPQADGSPNPLMVPYHIIYLEECAMLFAPSPNKEEKEIQAEILYYVTKLARESRSAGIHMVLATQYPTNASLPSIIRQQCRRIGLKTQDSVASSVIINEPGLENLIYKGTGKINQGGVYRDYKGFLIEHEADNNDVFNVLDTIGTNGGLFDTSTLGAGGGDGFIEVPPLEEAEFKRWESGVGNALKGIYDNGRKMKDLPTDILVDGTENTAFPEVDDARLRDIIRKQFETGHKS